MKWMRTAAAAGCAVCLMAGGAMGEDGGDDPPDMEEDMTAINCQTYTPVVWSGNYNYQWYDKTGTTTTYNICAPEELAGLAKLVNDSLINFAGKTVNLVADIYLNDVEGITGEPFPSNWNKWIPIGSLTKQFVGTFDGASGGSNKRKIYGLYIPEGGDYQGLFGYTTRTIRNLDMHIGLVKGGQYVGSVVGYGAIISGVTSNITVQGTSYVGGIAGWLWDTSESMYGVIGTIGSSSSTANISATGGYVGGLIGYGNVGSLSFSTGNVISTGGDYVGGLTGHGSVTGAVSAGTYTTYHTGTVSGRSYVGGLAGQTTGITRAYHRGSVTATAATTTGYVGGLAGQSSGNILTAYSYGPVSSGTGYYVGGLVGSITGSITDARDSGTVSSSSGHNVGGLAGSISSGSIKRSHHVNGAVSSLTGNYVGGLVGKMSTGDIDTSYHYGNVSGGTNIGGLVGEMISGKIRGATHANGDVAGSGTYVGGLAGYMSNSGITGSRHTNGNVGGGAEYVGGLAGSVMQGSGSLSNCKIENSHADSEVSGGDYVGGLVGNTVGDIVGNSSFTSGTVTGVNYVGGLAGNTTGSIESSHSDCDVTGSQDRVGGIVGASSAGSSSTKISYVSSRGNVIGRNFTGGLAGESSVNISNSFSLGTVFGRNEVGGLVGLRPLGTTTKIDSCYSESDVMAYEDDIGGLVGSFRGTVENSFAIGNVVGSLVGNTSSGNDNMGGLIGLTHGSGNIISKCYATGNVTGTGTLGGLVGRIAGTAISKSYATGDVTGTLTYVGGLVGLVESGTCSFSESYATGALAAASHIGGFVGDNSAAIPATFSKCFYNNEAVGADYGVGNPTEGADDGLTGKTDAQMKSAATFSGTGSANWAEWGTLWGINEGVSYPYFKKSASAPHITKHPEGGTVATGASHTLSVTANSTDGGSLTYQWYINVKSDTVGGIAIVNATDSSYQTLNYADGVYYLYVVVTNTNQHATENKTATKKSSVATVTVGDLTDLTHTVTYAVNGGTGALVPASVEVAHGERIASPPSTAGVTREGYTHLSGEWTIVPDGDSLFKFGTSVGTPVMSNWTLHMKWRVITDGGTWAAHPAQSVKYKEGGLTLADVPLNSGYTWEDITTPVDTLPTKTNSYAAVYVYQDPPGSGTFKSATGTISVTVTFPENAETPTITTQPVSPSGEQTAGTELPLTVTAAAVTDGGTLSYQWYRNITRSNSGGAPIAGATAASYTVTVEEGVSYYYVVVTNTNNIATSNKTMSTASAVVTIATVGSDTDEWDGTYDITWYNDTDTEFTIYTAEELAGVRYLVNNGNNFSGKTIILGANIMLNDTTGWANWSSSGAANSWTPIGTGSSYPFRGTFDGGGHVVSGVYFSNSSSSNRGLFGYLGSGGTIKDLGVEASYIYGSQYIGGLVGYNTGGTVERCYAKANVVSSNYYANSFIGVLVGGNYSSAKIKDSYAVGNVSGGYYVGGLVGTNETSAQIINSYAASTFGNYNSNYGGLAGYNSASITASYWDTDIFSYGNYGTGRTTAEMKQQASFSGWDFTDIWEIDENNGYPTLRVFNTTIGGGSTVYTIAFDLNNADPDAVPPDTLKDVPHGSRLTEDQMPPVPEGLLEKEGYYTDSLWYIDAASTTEFVFDANGGTRVLSNWLLYLGWHAKVPADWVAHDPDPVPVDYREGLTLGDVRLAPGYAWDAAVAATPLTVVLDDAGEPAEQSFAATYTGTDGRKLPAAGTIAVIVSVPETAAAPVIARQPAGVTDTAGAACTLSVSAYVPNGGGTMTFQWYTNVDASNSGGAPIVGATDSVYALTVVSGTSYYYVVVTNTNEAAAVTTASTASDAVTVTTVTGGAAFTFEESFENGIGEWVLVNGGQTNYWMIGTDTYYDGERSLYISNNGAANQYSTSWSSAVHAYRDITFPESDSAFTMKFYFKGYGEQNYDYMILSHSSTDITPSAGNDPAGTSLGSYWNNSSWSLKTVTLPAAVFSGTTRRIVFTWRNDGSGGSNPPAAIDSIVITNGDVVSPSVTHTINFNWNNAGVTAALPAPIPNITHGSRLTTAQKPPVPAGVVVPAGYYTDSLWYIDAASTTPFVFGANGTRVLTSRTLYLGWHARVPLWVKHAPDTVDVAYRPGLTLGDVPLNAGYAWNLPATPLAEALLGQPPQPYMATYTAPDGNSLPDSGQIYVRVTDMVQSYTLTVTGTTGWSGGTASGSSDHAPGALVMLEAGRAPSAPTIGMRMTFVRWTAEGVTLVNPTAPKTSFSMPYNDVSVAAEFEAVPDVAPAPFMTAGSNPVSLSNYSPSVSFYLTDAAWSLATLQIYSSTGSLVRTLKFTPGYNQTVSTSIGSWNLRNANSMQVSAGTYLVRGRIRMKDGTYRNVSFKLGVVN